jgi:hypothetical protein
MTTIKKNMQLFRVCKPALPFAELYYLDYTIKIVTHIIEKL